MSGPSETEESQVQVTCTVSAATRKVVVRGDKELTLRFREGELEKSFPLRVNEERATRVTLTPLGGKDVEGEAVTYRVTHRLPWYEQEGNWAVNRKDGSRLIRVPAGTFTMGTDDDQAILREEEADPALYRVHEVELSRDFYIGYTEVTWEQYLRFCDEVGAAQERDRYRALGVDADTAVTGISWTDARAYCVWAGLRLPTEAEWEYAARGADGFKFPWGPDWTPDLVVGNFSPALKSDLLRDGIAVNDDYEGLCPVEAFPDGASPFGCLGMGGNAQEWVSDWFGPYPEWRPGDLPTKDPQGPDKGQKRVARGGHWDRGLQMAQTYRRHPELPGQRRAWSGFRVARDVD